MANLYNGEEFIFSGMLTGVANSATVAYAFKTPSKASGMVVRLKCPEFAATASKVRNDLYEAPTNAPTGTDYTSYNKNRSGTPTASAMQAIKMSIVGLNLTGATMIENRQFVTNRSNNMEWTLKPDTWYIRTFTNQTGASCDIDFLETWIESLY